MPSVFNRLMHLNCMSSGEEPLPAQPLKMKTVDCDWMKSENEKAHHTDEYATDLLVIRRGQTFTTKMTFDRKFHKQADKIVLELNIGPKPQLMNQTKIKCPLVDTLESGKWGMKLIHEEEETFIATFEVNVPPKALIGRYQTFVELESKIDSGEVVKTRDAEPDLVILFNPWSKDDEVYLENEQERNEYCLSDVGAVYRGSQRYISPKAWNFGQFEPKILECCLLLLESDKRVKEKPAKWMQRRGDPVWVSRIISAMVNAQDDNGVLVGNWSGDYSGGASPTKWNGSVEILQQFYSTRKPVMFGQCWVFSGLVTTVLRCLGIPTRSVTNFASAHDTEGTMTIDDYVDESGEEIELGGDSVWNFHVWNECWMRRVDLPDGYDGWQAVDATPQEVSLGLYQTGPAPLTAIKKGEVYVGFETGFVFAEVNSDRIKWIVKQDENMDYSIVDIGSRWTRSVGKYISTKAVGKNERLDITNLYKAPEGTAEEREAFRRAYVHGSIPDYQKGFLALHEEGKGVSLDFSSTSDVLRNGDGFSIMIKAQNDTDAQITVDLSAVLHSTLYTGKKKFFIKRQRFSAIPIEAKSSVTREFAVVYSDYNTKLVDLNSLRLQAVAKIHSTGKMYSDDYEFRLDNKDSIDIRVDPKLKVNTQANVSVTFTNPLPTRLTGVVITLEGPGLATPVVKKVKGQILPGDSTEITVPIVPKKLGKRSILVDVDTKQVKDLKGIAEVEVIS